MSSTSSSSSSTSSSQPPPWPSSAHFQTSSASSSSDSSAPSSPLSPVTQLVSPPASSNRKRSSGFQVLSRPAPKSHQASVSAPCSFPLSNGDSVPSSGHNTSLGLDFSAPSDAPGMTAALPPVTNVLVTQDGDTLAKCDLTGSTDALVIREKILSKLRIDDSEQDRCAIHRGRFQAGQEGPPLTDQELWDACSSIVPSNSSPPLFFVSISGPTLGTAPLMSPSAMLYGIENKVASLDDDDSSNTASVHHQLRSTNPKWHKARASDPESSPRSPPLPQQQSAVYASSSKRPGSSGRSDPTSGPMSPNLRQSTDSNGSHASNYPSHASSSASNPNNNNHDGRRTSSESLRSNGSPHQGRLPAGAADVRRTLPESFADPNQQQQDWMTNAPGPSSSSAAMRQDALRLGLSPRPGSASRDGSTWEWQGPRGSQYPPPPQRVRKTSWDEQSHLRQTASSRPDWEEQRLIGHPKSKSSTSYPVPTSGTLPHLPPQQQQQQQQQQQHHQDIGSQPMRPQRSQPNFNSPAGFGASGPVFRSNVPPYANGRMPQQYPAQGGFGPTGPTAPRMALPPSVRPAPAAPSSHHSSSSSSRPGSRPPLFNAATTHAQTHPVLLNPPPARSIHAARSVDDLRQRQRPAGKDPVPPLPPNARHLPPQNMNFGRGHPRWIPEEPSSRPATTSQAGRMPFPGTSGPPSMHQSATLPPHTQMQPHYASPYPSYSSQTGRSSQQQPLSKSPHMPSAANWSHSNNNMQYQSVDGPRADPSGAPLKRSPACNPVAIDYHNSLPLQPGGTLQDALRPKESRPKEPEQPPPRPSSSQLPPTAEHPANLRAGVPSAATRAIQVTRRQHSGQERAKSPNVGAVDHRYPTHTPTSSVSSTSSTREAHLPFPGSPPATFNSSPNNNNNSNNSSQPPTPRPSSSRGRSPGFSPEQSTDDAYAGSVLDEDQRRPSDRPPSLSHSASTRNSSILASPHDESSPPLPVATFEPSAPPLWEDDLPEFSNVLQHEHGEDAQDEEQATVKGDDWANILRKIQEGEADVDQLVPYATGPFPDDAAFHDAPFTMPDSAAGSSNAEDHHSTPSTSQPSWGCSMEDFDDDDSDEEKTWAVAPGTARPQELAQIREANEQKRQANANASTASPRPSLSLQIENLPMPQRPGETSSDSPPKTRQLDPTPSSEPLDDQWAVRPSIERVYDNLERFFPDHDLDKPIIDAGAPPVVSSPATSPSAGASQSSTAPTPSAPSPSTGPPPAELQRFKHKKSIRIVAQDRKRLLQRAESAVSRAVDGAATRAQGLLRRKSTKLWGIRTEEVTPRQAKLAAPASAAIGLSEGSSDPDSASFKWMKGELIGKGSYGKVYLGFNVTTGDMLAVKQVEMPQTSSDKDNEDQSNVVNALKSEIGMLQDFDHVNIVQFLGYNESPEYLSIFLEYVPGGSIGRCIRKNYLATRRGFEESLIKDFTGQILSGLAYLHERGVLHRDLKADNVLVDMAGTCKISDFGISKKSEDIYNDNVEMSMQGSIFWMAPEVIDSGKRGYSAKVDIWSLGCVALEMVSGRRPFHEYQMMQALFKLGAGRMAPPVPEDVVVSSEATEFMTRCFTIDPVARPTAVELQSDPFMVADEGYTFESTSLARMLKARG